MGLNIGPSARAVTPLENPDELPEGPGLASQLGAAFNRENVTVTAFREGYNAIMDAPDAPVDLDFNVAEHLTPQELMRFDAGAFSSIRSAGDLTKFRERVTREDDWQSRIDEGPAPAWLAATIAAVADPVNLIPFAGAATKGPLAARLARGAAVGALEVGATETALQAAQETRTTRESLEAIALGGLIGGGFVGAGAAIRSAVDKGLEAQIRTDFRATMDQAFGPQSGELSIGAAQAESRAAWSRMTAEDTEFVGQKVLQPVLERMGRIGLASPGLVLASSRFSEMRKLSHRLFDVSAITKGEMQGRALGDVPLDIRVRSHDAQIADFSKGVSVMHAEARKAGYGGNVRQFREDVGRFLINGEAAHPSVAEAGKATREKVFKPWLQKLQDDGVWQALGFTEPPKDYVNRVYDRDAIVRQPGFRAAVRDWLRDEITRFNEVGEKVMSRKLDLEEKMKADKDALLSRRENIADLPENQRAAAKERLKVEENRVKQKWAREEEFDKKATPDWYQNWRQKEMSPADADEIARQIEESIMGSGGPLQGVQPIPNAKGPLKGRTLSIPNHLIANWLEKDVDKLVGTYVRRVANDYESYRTFGTFDYEEIVAPLSREKDAALDKAKTPEERAQIQAVHQAQLKEFERAYSQIRDIVPPPAMIGLARVGANLRTINFARSMGSVLAAQVSDLGTVALEHGVHRVFGSLISDMTTGFKGLRLSKRQAQAFGVALDLQLNRRSRQLWDAQADYHLAGAGRFTKGVQWLGGKMSQISGMNHWTMLTETLASGLASTRIIKMAEKVASGRELTKFERLKAAQMNLTPEILTAIHGERANFQEIRGSLGGKFVSGNIAAWGDARAADAFKMAVIRDVENSIISAGAQDVPTWMNHYQLGKLVSQFRKFSFAAVNKVMVPGAQRLSSGDINAWTALGTYAGLGALSVALYDLVSKGEIEDRSSASWVKQSIDRSGMLGWYFEMEGMFEQTAGTSPSQYLTGAPVRRFQGRTAPEMIAGPTAGFAMDIANTVSAISPFIKGKDAEGMDFTRQDLHKVRRLVPFQNYIATRLLVDKMELSLAESLDLRDAGKKKTVASAGN